MTVSLNFNLGKIEHSEFGVGRDIDDSQAFYSVRVDSEAQHALQEMVRLTWSDMEKSVAGSPTQTEFQEMQSESGPSRFVPMSDEQTMRLQLAGGPKTYSPSEKYAGKEYILLNLENTLVSPLRDLHRANNLPYDNQLFDDTDSIFCYFTRMLDDGGRRITAIRRASGFKGVLKSTLLAQLTGGGLELYQGKIFKLDNDFDIIVDSEHVHVWRPNSFESVGRLKQDILDAVPNNIEAIEDAIDYIDFGTIHIYARERIMAARYLASIRAQVSEGPISKDALVSLCSYTNVAIEERNGKIFVAKENVMSFLEVLDRRRYGIELVEGQREQFRASSRQRIDV